MKKLFLFLLLASNFVMQAFTPTVVKTAQYRWRNDDGNEASATWKADLSIPIVQTLRNQNIRLLLSYDDQDYTKPARNKL